MFSLTFINKKKQELLIFQSDLIYFHFPENDIILFFLWLNGMSFLSLSVWSVFSLSNHELDRYLDGCHSLDIVNTATRVPLHYAILIPLGMYSEVAELNHMGVLFSVLMRNRHTDFHSRQC